MVKKKEVNDKEENLVVEKTSNCEECKCKKNNVEKASYSVVFVILFGFCTFVLGLGIGAVLTLKDNDLDKIETLEKEEQNNETTEENKELKVDEKLIMELILSLSLLEPKGQSFTAEELTNSELLEFATEYRGMEKESNDSFTLEELNVVTKKIFGREVTGANVLCLINPGSEITIESFKYIYDKENKVFNRNEEHGGHGGGGYYPNVFNRIVSIDNKDNTYTVKVKKVFAVYPDTGPASGYFKTYNEIFLEDSKPVFEYEFYDDGTMFDEEKAFDKVPDEDLITYTYVFEVIDNNLVFKSYSF